MDIREAAFESVRCTVAYSSPGDTGFARYSAPRRRASASTPRSGKPVITMAGIGLGAIAIRCRPL